MQTQTFHMSLAYEGKDAIWIRYPTTCRLRWSGCSRRSAGAWVGWWCSGGDRDRGRADERLLYAALPSTWWRRWPAGAGIELIGAVCTGP